MKTIIILLFMINFYILGIDTTETFNLGYSDFEIYHNISNFDDKIDSDIVLGVGITKNLSSSFLISITKDETSFSGGLFSTIYNSKNFDIDLYYSFDSSMKFLIGNEINIDFKNFNLGIYIKNEYIFNSDYFIAIGSYYNVSDKLTFLMEFDLSINKKKKSKVSILGINYLIKENIELITEYSFNIDEKNSNFSTGLIFTI